MTFYQYKSLSSSDELLYIGLAAGYAQRSFSVYHRFHNINAF